MHPAYKADALLLGYCCGSGSVKERGFLILNAACSVVTPCQFSPMSEFSLELRTVNTVFFAVCFCDKTVPSYESLLSSVYGPLAIEEGFGVVVPLFSSRRRYLQ